MNELDKLREMLDKAGIPYENLQVEYALGTESANEARRYGDAGRWKVNQVVYGRVSDRSWLWDGVFQAGSYGAARGMIESFGKLGRDVKTKAPRIVDAKEAFEIIKADYERRKIDV